MTPVSCMQLIAHLKMKDVQLKNGTITSRSKPNSKALKMDHRVIFQLLVEYIRLLNVKKVKQEMRY